MPSNNPYCRNQYCGKQNVEYKENMINSNLNNNSNTNNINSIFGFSKGQINLNTEFRAKETLSCFVDGGVSL